MPLRIGERFDQPCRLTDVPDFRLDVTFLRVVVGFRYSGKGGLLYREILLRSIKSYTQPQDFRQYSIVDEAEYQVPLFDQTV
jgi:hypothetical protein